MKNLKFTILCFLSAFLLFGCKKDKTPEIADYSEYKSDEWRSLIGDTIEVEGYLKLNDDGTGVLMAAKEDYFANALIPEKRYIALSSEFIRTLDPETTLLAKVRIKGVVKATTNPSRTILSRLTTFDFSQFELRPVKDPVILVPALPNLTTIPTFCDQYPALCNIADTDPEKFALLYSGGVNKDNAHKRYWNDMKLYYNILINVYGYDPDNIIVVYKDGEAEDDDMFVNYAATNAGINSALFDLQNMMTADDNFFFFMTNHGGTQDDAVTINDEYADDKIDECTYFYDENTTPYDDNVKSWIDRLDFANMICVMEQCYSGGMIYDLRGPNRIIISAANEFQLSYGSAKYDDFVLLFLSGLVGGHLDKVLQPVNSDANDDGNVSILEAFIWAKDSDPHDEEPQYEDSGDGSSVANPSLNATGTADGVRGKTIYGL